MSFDFNPFRHIEVVLEDEEDDMWSAYCNGCGAVLKMHSSGEPIGTFIDNIKAHLSSSHDRTPEDMKGWSTF